MAEMSNPHHYMSVQPLPQLSHLHPLCRLHIAPPSPYTTCVVFPYPMYCTCYITLLLSLPTSPQSFFSHVHRVSAPVSSTNPPFHSYAYCSLIYFKTFMHFLDFQSIHLISPQWQPPAHLHCLYTRLLCFIPLSSFTTFSKWVKVFLSSHSAISANCIGLSVLGLLGHCLAKSSSQQPCSCLAKSSSQLLCS